MSTTIDKMKQAMEKRKALESSMQEENSMQSVKHPVPSNKIVSRLFLMRIIWAVILGGIIYVGITNSSKDSLATIVAKLDHLENRFAPLQEQLRKVEETIKTVNADSSQGEFSNSSLTAQTPPRPKKMPAPMETVKLPARQEKAPAAASNMPASDPQGEIRQQGQPYHKVERGETLYRISKRYGIAVAEICRLNNFKQGQAIQPGQVLLVSPARH